MKIRAYALAIAVFSSVALALAPRQAAAAIVTCSNPLPGAQYIRTGGQTFTVGTVFTPGSSMLITQLGVQDTPSNGLAPSGSNTGFIAASIHVGIWDSTNTLIAQANVISSDTLGTGDYRYDAILKDGTGTTIPSITLNAGSSYSIGALVGPGLANFLDGETTTPNIHPFGADTGISSTTSNYDGAAGVFGAPGTGGPSGVTNGRWGPANAIPEPSSIGLFAVIGAVIAGRRRAR